MAYSEECKKKKQLKRHVPRLRRWRRIAHARTASGYSNTFYKIANNVLITTGKAFISCEKMFRNLIKTC